MAASGRAFALSRQHRLPRVVAGPPPAGATLELAWDGHRVLVVRGTDEVRLVAESYRDFAPRFPGLVRAIGKLPGETLVAEGFLVALDAHRRPSFALLRDHVAAGSPLQGGPPLALLLSDLRALDGEDLRALPLAERRARLHRLLEGRGGALALSGAVKGTLAEATALAVTLGQLGVLARSDDADAPLTRVEGPLPSRNLSPPAELTNADKVLYPRDGLRKVDVAAYYRDVAPVLLPLLRERPVVCQRWPDGIDDFTWYQHRMPPKAPDYLRSVWIDVEHDADDPRFRSRAERTTREDKARRRAALDPEPPARPAGPRRDRRIVIDEPEGLLYMVNQAALTFHGWASRVGTLDEPDWAIFDLDPPEGAAFSSLVEIAQALRKLLEMLGVESHPKTSGQKGLHVLVPLAPGHTIETVQRFAEGVARVVAHTLPTKVTLETERDKRLGRVYLDHGQNFRGKTLVAPYSLRAVDGAPASTPLRWDEVGPRLDPRAFTLRTLRARLDRVGDLAAALLDGRQALGPALAKLP